MWYHLEKFVQGHLSAETFEEFIDKSKEEIQDYAEDWAEHINSGGSNYGWRLDWRKVNTPPEDWLIKECQYHAARQEYHMTQLMKLNSYADAPKTYYQISYFDDKKKKWILLKEQYSTKIIANKAKENIQKLSLEEYKKSIDDFNNKKTKKIPKRHYIFKVDTIRTIKYLK